MNNVDFEGLGLSFKVNSVFAEIIGIKVYWYALFIIIGVIIGLIFCCRDNGKYDIEFDDILELMIFMLPVSFISARLFYILFNLNYYLSNPIEIINIRNGGLAIYGGIIGAVITTMWFSKNKKIDLLDLLDYLAPYLALGQCIGRWGNFFNVEAYGVETTSILRMGIYENGKYMQVHPTFLYESVCTLLIFIILYSIRNKREYSGQITCMYLFLYGITRAVIEGLRADSLMIGDYRISQLISIILAITFGAILLIKKVRK